MDSTTLMFTESEPVVDQHELASKPTNTSLWQNTTRPLQRSRTTMQSSLPSIRPFIQDRELYADF